jgi:perosamine synthetase
MPTVVFSDSSRITREHLVQAFHEQNIDARVFFWPLSSLGIFDAVEENRISRKISNKAINLPSFHDISTHEMDRVLDTLIRTINKIQ